MSEETTTIEAEIIDEENPFPSKNEETPSILVTEVLAEKEANKKTTTEEEALQHALAMNGVMAVGDRRFGITCTGEPIMHDHWLSDSSVCGDMVMALPSSILIEARSNVAQGVAVDMFIFLDAIIEGASRFAGIPGIMEAATLPGWAVSRMMGTFPALTAVYHEALDQAVLTVEAAAFKAAAGMDVTNTRSVVKKRDGKTTEQTREVLHKKLAPDAALSKMILTNRMKGRYNVDGGVQQAVQINLIGAEADL